MVLDEVPGQFAVFVHMEGDSELDGSVLVADLVGDGIFESAPSKFGIFKHGKQAQSPGLEFGIVGGLRDFLQLVEEGSIAIMRGDLQGALSEVRIDRSWVAEVFGTDFTRLGKNLLILRLAQSGKEKGAQLLFVGRVRGGRRT